ncbi:MAG: cadherin-like domain-containing protein, partial [Nitrospirales bacterium]
SGHDFHDETSYIFTLNVQDADGLRDTTSVQIFPDKVDFTFQTNPPGLNLFLDQVPIVTPFIHDTLIGFEHTVMAPPTQCKQGVSYGLTAWTDGDVVSLKTVTVPPHNQMLTAQYTAVGTCPLEDLVIDRMTVGSGKVYPTFRLGRNELMYTDRPFRFQAPIPAVLDGQQTIRTANLDKSSSTSELSFLQFSVNQAVDVYLLYTNEGTTLEADWAHEGQGWGLQDFTVPSSLNGAERQRLVRKRSFPAGPIRLPGNGSIAGLSSMYHVVIVPSGAGNHAPVAIDDTVTMTMNTSFDIPVLANDTDPNGEAVTIINVTPSNHGGTTINTGTSIQYTPSADFTGVDSFAYTIRDAQGAEDTATVTVTVNPVSQELRIENITVGSESVYPTFALAEGALMYTDRPFTFQAPIPAVLEGQLAIRTANLDKFSSTEETAFLQFDVTQDVEVYLLYTNVNTTLETDWLEEGEGWELQNFTVPCSLNGVERNRVVRKKSFPAGPIRLPGNGSITGTSSMYHVVVVPRKE